MSLFDLQLEISPVNALLIDGENASKMLALHLSFLLDFS